jgi:hypothetical protein
MLHDYQITLSHRNLYQEPMNIIPSQLMVGSITYDDPALVAPFGVDVVTNLTAFREEIRSDWPGEDVSQLIRLYSPNRYSGSLMNAYSQYQGDKKMVCNQRQFAEYTANAMLDGRIGEVYLYQYGKKTNYDPAELSGLFYEFYNPYTNWATNGAEIPMM